MRQLRYVVVLSILLIAGALFTPHTAQAGCCVGTTGNVNMAGIVDGGDLALLVAYLTNPPGSKPTFVCPEEANVNNAGIVDGGDLALLVAYLTNAPTQKPTLPNCPASADVVFTDAYGDKTTYQAFAGSKLDAVQITTETVYAGTQGLEITILDVGYSGGAFTDSVGRDLSAFNALTFWAKASVAATLNVAGIGNDNTGTSKYMAEVTNLALTTDWAKYTIPLPLASKLSTEKGLFYFAEGPESGLGYTIWIDEIIFENLATVTNPRPALNTQTIEAETGETVNVGNGSVTFDVGGTDITESVMQGYFTFTSSNESVVSVGLDGTISAVSVGTATLTAKLGTIDATGSITVNVSDAQVTPSTPAPTPSVPSDSVVSLFSDAYTNVTVDTWSAVWDMADVEDYLIGSDNTKKYTNFVYAGIEFTSATVDASAMTYFHMDVWTPDPTAAPAVFKVKLIDFGADGAYGGGDDVEHELTFDETTMNTGEWVSIEVPLISFTNLTTRAHLAQMIISGNLSTVYVDNVYFFKAGSITAPNTPAPTPTASPADAVSLYSDAYTSATIDTWSAVWDMADVEDYLIGSDNVKKYTNLVYAGIEFTSAPVDASAMTHFHMDIWTPDPTAAPAVFKVKLVDFGGDGAYGGGDDVEHELTFDHTVLSSGIWVGIDIPVSNFTNLTTRGHLAQMIISGDLSTIYLDNIYFYDAGVPTEPAAPAPTPTASQVDVISLYSDAYTNATVDTWSAGWDMADVSDVLVGTDNVKKYTNLVYAGIEFTSTTIDATAMTHFHMDVWTPDPTAAPAVFKVKLVDFGANGVWDGGGDDVEHELTFDETTMNTGEWVSIEVPLSSFTNLTTQGHLAQMIISSDPNTIYIDNVYFHK